MRPRRRGHPSSRSRRRSRSRPRPRRGRQCNAVVSAAPAPDLLSSSRIPATSGPRTAPRPPRTPPRLRGRSVRPRRAVRPGRHDLRPTDPSAITGISGPSTAPNASVPIAASTTPGPYDGGVGLALNPAERPWPPSPGRNRRASHTTQGPDDGQPDTRNHGGAAYPREAGSSSHSQSSSPWIRPRKSAAASAAGIPMRAAMPTRRRYSAADGGACGRLSIDSFAQLLTHELSDAVPRELADLPDRGGNGVGRQLASGAVESSVVVDASDTSTTKPAPTWPPSAHGTPTTPASATATLASSTRSTSPGKTTPPAVSKPVGEAVDDPDVAVDRPCAPHRPSAATRHRASTSPPSRPGGASNPPSRSDREPCSSPGRTGRDLATIGVDDPHVHEPPGRPAEPIFSRRLAPRQSSSASGPASDRP